MGDLMRNTIYADAGLILIVQQNPRTRATYRAALEQAGYEIVEAADCKQALDLVAQRRPDLVVQDLMLPDMDGLELARRLRGQFGATSVPILCVSGFLSRVDEARAMRSGFADVLIKPIDPAQLRDVVKLHLVRPVVSETRGERRRLLFVDKDPVHRRFAQAGFANAGFDVIEAEDGLAALELARQQHPAVIVSDVLMPKMDGFALCLAVRRDKELGATPVVLSSWAYMDQADRTLATRVGASALLSKAEGLEAMTRAVLAALTAAPPAPEIEPGELQTGDHIHRAQWQLERQVQESARLLRRSVLREAQLAVLDGVVQALAKSRSVDGVLEDVLSACLDMAGISKGALYITKAGQLALEHHIGFSADEAAGLHDMFGCSDTLARIAAGGDVVLVPSTEFPADVARQLAERAGVTALLLVPVSWAATTYGLMILGATTVEITGKDAIDFASALGTRMGLAMGLAHSFTSLAASEQRYRNLTENANDAICILTPSGTICEVNRRLTEIIGAPASTIVGHHMRDFAAPGRPRANIESFSGALEVGAGRAPPVALRTGDGGVALVEFSHTHVQVGNEALVLAIGRDVTLSGSRPDAADRTRIAWRLSARSRLASRTRSITRSVRSSRTSTTRSTRPRCWSPTSIDRRRGWARSSDSLGDARAAGVRVRQIVRDLRIFSRGEEDRRGAVDVHRVLDSMVRMASNEIRHRAQLVKMFGKIPLVEANEGTSRSGCS